MTENIPYRKCYADSDLSLTAILSLEEKGAYYELKNLMWVSGGSLPNDDEKIARLLRISKKKWIKIKENLREVFSFEPKEIVEKSLRNEFLEAQNKREKLKQNGKAGGLKRAKNLETGQAIATTNATDLLEQLPKPTNTNTIKEKDKKEKIDELFEECKKIYLAIPDFQTEWNSMMEWFAEKKTLPKRQAVCNWLNRSHQAYLAKKPPAPKPKPKRLNLKNPEDLRIFRSCD